MDGEYGKMKTIAVDFDGCLCVNKYPEIGAENELAIRNLIHLKNEGCKLILWTCRSGADLDEAVKWCNMRGLFFDAVNENLPEHIAEYGRDCRKVFATEYWDDRSVLVKAR